MHYRNRISDDSKALSTHFSLHLHIKSSETEFDLSNLDMNNAIITNRGASEKFRPRERLVLVPKRQNSIIDEDAPKKKLSITARNNLRKKAKREAKERAKQINNE